MERQRTKKRAEQESGVEGMAGKVVVIGSLNYDICLKQERMPKEGETYFADSVNYCSGGKGANQAVQAAKLGMETYMVGCIGDDVMGKFLKHTLEQYHVRTDYLRIRGENSGMSVAQSLYDGGVRASVVLGANELVSVEDVQALDGFLEVGDIAVFQLEIPVSVVEYAISFCKDRGCFAILNGAPAAELKEEVLKQVDVFVVNEVEASFFCKTAVTSGETAEREIRKMTKELGNICIFTLGKTGSMVCQGEQFEFIPSIEVQAVESTGAGDSFIGGLCYGLMNHMDVFDAARFATCCSAKTVCKIGGQPAMPTLEEVGDIWIDA